MIRFLLVDNDVTFLEKLECMISNQCKTLSIEYEISISLNGEGVDFTIIDFVFLDIDLNEDENGISIAKRVRKRNKNCKIIFITSHEHLMHDTLRVQPFYFVRKKDINEDMAVAFLLIKEYYRHKEIYSFNYNGRQKNINVDDILYLETTDHVTTLYTKDDQKFYFYKTLQQIEESINSNDLCRIQKKYCVNMKNIMLIDGNNVEMVNGTILSIGRAYKNRFLDVYNKYIIKAEDTLYV